MADEKLKRLALMIGTAGRKVSLKFLIQIKWRIDKSANNEAWHPLLHLSENSHYPY